MDMDTDSDVKMDANGMNVLHGVRKVGGFAESLENLRSPYSNFANEHSFENPRFCGCEFADSRDSSGKLRILQSRRDHPIT